MTSNSIILFPFLLLRDRQNRKGCVCFVYALKCRGLAEWETLLEPGECECVTLLGQIISEIDTGSEKKKAQWGKREGKELCAQGLGFLIHAAECRAPPTAWIPAVPRHRQRVTQDLGAATAGARGDSQPCSPAPRTELC